MWWRKGAKKTHLDEDCFEKPPWKRSDVSSDDLELQRFEHLAQFHHCVCPFAACQTHHSSFLPHVGNAQLHPPHQNQLKIQTNNNKKRTTPHIIFIQQITTTPHHFYTINNTREREKGVHIKDFNWGVSWTDWIVYLLSSLLLGPQHHRKLFLLKVIAWTTLLRHPRFKIHYLSLDYLLLLVQILDVVNSILNNWSLIHLQHTNATHHSTTDTNSQTWSMPFSSLFSLYSTLPIMIAHTK